MVVLTLTLFMFRIFANYHNATATANDATFIAHFFNRCSNFHAYILATLQAYYYINYQVFWQSLK